MGAGVPIDFAVVRENTEGAYAGEGGSCGRGRRRGGHPGFGEHPAGVERCVRFAFELAEARRRRLTLVHKTNVLTYSGDLWQRVFNEVATEHPEVETGYNHVDAACIYMVDRPAVTTWSSPTTSSATS